MREDKRRKRHQAIAEAAYALLAEKGYGGTSMLAIAKTARASNETLYRWYGDKKGLFEAMARDNAATIRQMLEQAAGDAVDPMATLERIGPLLLTMLLGDRAIMLNRAAAADPSGELGAAISAGGRDVIAPLIEGLIARVAPNHPSEPAVLTGWYLGLLIGDLQIRRAIGVMPRPSAKDIRHRSTTALAAFVALLGAT